MLAVGVTPGKVPNDMGEGVKVRCNDGGREGMIREKEDRIAAVGGDCRGRRWWCVAWRFFEEGCQEVPRANGTQDR